MFTVVRELLGGGLGAQEGRRWVVRGLETGMQCLCSGIFVIPVLWPPCRCPSLSAALIVPVSSARLLDGGSLS